MYLTIGVILASITFLAMTIIAHLNWFREYVLTVLEEGNPIRRSLQIYTDGYIKGWYGNRTEFNNVERAANFVLYLFLWGVTSAGISLLFLLTWGIITPVGLIIYLITRKLKKQEKES